MYSASDWLDPWYEASIYYNVLSWDPKKSVLNIYRALLGLSPVKTAVGLAQVQRLEAYMTMQNAL